MRTCICMMLQVRLSSLGDATLRFCPACPACNCLSPVWTSSTSFHFGPLEPPLLTFKSYYGMGNRKSIFRSSYIRDDVIIVSSNRLGDDDDDGDEDEESGEKEEVLPSCGDYVMHYLSLFWKLLFATVPPTGLFENIAR